MTPKKPNPYQEMDIRPGEDHPLDIIVQSQIPTTLLDDIQIATKHLLRRLGVENRPWLDLEALLNEYRQQREEILFNLGYENGFTAGCTQTLSRLRHQPPDIDHYHLMGQIRKTLILAQNSPKSKVAALLETALALMAESQSMSS